MYGLTSSAHSKVETVTTPTISSPPMLAFRPWASFSSMTLLGESTIPRLFIQAMKRPPRSSVRISPVTIAPAERTVR